MKKLISILLALVITMLIFVPAVAADGGTKYITIYVEGQGTTLYRNNEVIYPTGADVGAIVSEAIKPCLKELANGVFTGDYDKYCDELYKAVAPIYDKLRLDKNGEASDGSNAGKDMLKDSYSIKYNEGFTGGRITFRYDWRLSVEYNGEILEKFVDRVCKEKKTDKVNIVGRCLGANIVNAYLQNGKNLDKINKVVLYAPSTLGIATVGAVFSGNIVLDEDAVENFGNYLLDTRELLEDPALQSLISSLIPVLNYARVLGLGTDALELIIENVRTNLIPRLVRDTYGSFPSFWAMCPPEDLLDAVEFCYSTTELKEAYAGMIDKILSYYNNVQLNAADRMKELKADGIEFMVISKYDCPNLPLSDEGKAQSDSVAETSRTSFGSVSPEYGKVFSDSYIASKSEEERKYISPDRKVDASACLFPDNTWFLKNNTHKEFPDAVDKLMNTFVITDNFTVWSSESYPQYTYINDAKDTLIPVVVADEPVDDKDSVPRIIRMFLNFFTSIFQFLTNLFKK